LTKLSDSLYVSPTQVTDLLVWWPVCWSVQMVRQLRLRLLTAQSPDITENTRRYDRL